MIDPAQLIGTRQVLSRSSLAAVVAMVVAGLDAVVALVVSRELGPGCQLLPTTA